MRTLSIILILVLLSPFVAAIQEPTESVQIRVILVDKELTQKPVPHFELKFTNLDNSSAPPVTAKTALDGSLTVRLSKGRYRIASSQSIEFQNHRYGWEFEIVVSGPNQVVELSNDNSTMTDAAPTTPTRKTDELTTMFQHYQNSVVTVWSEIGQGTGFIVNSRGLIVTNQHVIGPSEILSVQFDAKRKVAAKLLTFDAEKDVAVLWADLSAFPDAIAAPIARAENGQPTVVEGERVFTIGSPLSRRKILTTGIVSKVEARAIISDLNINHGNSGGPLFNSVGQVIGITTFKEQATSVAGVIRIEEVMPTLEQASKKMADTTPPSSRLLPVEPQDSYPLSSLKESIENEKFDRKPYVFSEGGFNIALITPVLRYWLREEGNISAAREKEKRTKKTAAAVTNTFEPLQDLRGWAEYVGEYQPVLLIEAQPQLREAFWSALGRGLASSNGNYAGPARMKFVTDFYRMRLYCGDREVEPIQPGKAATVENIHNYFVNVNDATYEGVYSYPADAISPACGRVTLEVFSETDPNKATVKILSDKTVERIGEDFQPYLNGRPHVRESRKMSDSAVGGASLSSGDPPAVKAVDWTNENLASVEAAANDGDARAQFEIGNRSYLGQKGANKDYSKALIWYQKAAAVGSAGAQVNLGLMYAQGQGVAQDYAQALTWYRKAADQGLASAQSNIGALYFKGQGVAQDYAQARVWFLKAADQGLASAQVSVGSLYRLGLGVVQDDVQAAIWFRKASDQGDPSAQNNMGALYYSGVGVPQDFGQAFLLFRKAADQGDVGAQRNLGILYENGQGVTRDLAQARIWYQKAADQGNAAAKERLRALAGQN